MSHTPGPWVIDEFLPEHGIYKIRGKDDVLCLIHSVSETDDPDSESTANARLIASAPELLAALRDLRAAATEAYKTGRIEAAPFVHAGNVLAQAQGR
jgi:hypothetical protein